jgi:RND family efflux transporter MFP subunit
MSIIVIAGRHRPARGSASGGEYRLRLTSLAMISLAAAALALPASPATAESGWPAAVPAASRPVLVTNVHYEALTPDRSFVAVIRPRVEADLGFRVSGKVARRLVDVGQRVKAGDALAELDDTDLRLQREQAEAEARSLASAVAQAAAEEQRTLNLRKQGWSADATVERARATADDARARKEKADRALSLAENALGYAVLRADADGVVTAAPVDRGQVVTAGQAAIRVARLEEREAVVAVPETLVAHVGQGEASLSLWSNPDRRYKAVLRELSPVADTATRTYAARFSLHDAGDEVKLGMTATLIQSDAGAGQAARLPLSALFNQGTGPSVWCVDPASGALALKPVDVVRYGGRDVFVRSGISEGDMVVTLGVQKLDAGARVRVVQALGF